MKFRAAIVLMSAVLLSACGLNSVPKAEENAKARWADVQAAYQRRANLIPNIVATVKGAAASEDKILTDVISARSRATSIQVTGADLSDPAKVQQYQAAQTALGGSLGRLLATAEAYPNLKSQERFGDLVTELEGTENPHHHRDPRLQRRGAELQHHDPDLPRCDRRQGVLRRQADDAVPGAGRRGECPDGRLRERELRREAAGAKSMTMWRAALTLLAALLIGAPAAQAQTYPKFTGFVVDAANALPPETEAALTAKLDALQRDTHRQLIVATIPTSRAIRSRIMASV